MAYLRNQPYDEKDFPAFAAIREQFGFLPNFFPEQTARPDMVDAEIAMTANLVVKEGTYCVTAHCEIVRMIKLEGPEPEQIAIDHVHAKIPIADKGLLNFCTKLNSQPSKVGPDDIQALRTFGFTEQQILEAILIVGWAKFANTVAFGLGTVPDFHNRRIAEELGKARAAEREAQMRAAG